MTDQNQATVDLKSPDTPNSAAQFTWDVEFQRQIIALLLGDRQFLLQSIDLIEPDYFSNRAHKLAAEELFNYYRNYGAVPTKTSLLEQVRGRLGNDKAKLAHLSEVNSLYEYIHLGVESREYLTDKILYFAKMQAFRKAWTESWNLISSDPESDKTWTTVQEKLRVALNTDRNFEPGLDYFATVNERYDHMAKDDNTDELFITGFHSFDSRIKGGGYRRGEMVSVTAGSGVGKSLWLSNMAATNALRDKKILYISLELSEYRVAERFDSILTGTSIKYLLENKTSIFNKLERIVADKDDKKLIVVKQFPGRQATTATIRAYLSQLKFYGFTPDVVIVDYIGEMKPHPGMSKHDSFELIVGELRALAEEEQVFMASAMQPNRSSKEIQKAGRIEEEHLADSFGQMRPLDGLLSLNQNEAEKVLGIGRGWVIKQRFGESRYEFNLKIDRETLRITEISKETYARLMANRTEKMADDVAIDLVVKPYTPPQEEKETDE